MKLLKEELAKDFAQKFDSFNDSKTKEIDAKLTTTKTQLESIITQIRDGNDHKISALEFVLISLDEKFRSIKDQMITPLIEKIDQIS